VASAKKKRGPGTPPREERNLDPHWTNWEVLAAFGEDERGDTYLDAVKRFCCLPSEEDVWLDELVRAAHRAHDRAGSCQTGRMAAWRVFRRAGMILLHDFMEDLQVETGRLKPRAAFYWPAKAMTVVITTNWRVDTDVK